tara:strand:- start:233 stop:445 length:213 start_codon:yes stop_codon:yes gene_type:complete
MYQPTSISGLDIDSGEKQIKLGKISANLALISQETNLLDDKISGNAVKISENVKQLNDEISNFEASFLDI